MRGRGHIDAGHDLAGGFGGSRTADWWEYFLYHSSFLTLRYRLRAARVVASTIIARTSDTFAPHCARFLAACRSVVHVILVPLFMAHTGRHIALFRVSEVVHPVTGRHHRM